MMYILSAHRQSQLDRTEPKRLLKKMSIWDAIQLTDPLLVEFGTVQVLQWIYGLVV